MEKPTKETAAASDGQGPFEIERKYLIEYPDIGWLESLPECRKVDIIQTYLLSPKGDTVRVRQWEEGGRCTYIETAKRRVTDMTRVEIERCLTRQEYLARLADADPSRRPIRKTRYCLPRDGQVFEIDVYPFWDDVAVMEIELSDEEQEIRFPRELKIIREVTGDARFLNSSLARQIPREL